MRGLAERELPERELLPIWEETQSVGPLARAMALLAAAAPDLAADERERLTVGQRDAALLGLHVRTFGPRLDGFVHCPGCDAALELELDETKLRAIRDAQAELGEHTLAVSGYELRFRPVTCSDLEAAAGAADAAAARLRLVERCVLEANRESTPVAPSALPEEVVRTLAARLAECDPQAEIGLSVCCPECEHEWRALVEVSSFLAAEISAAALRLLEEVHELALRYGWSEAEVLALTRRRRRSYLELAVP